MQSQTPGRERMEKSLIRLARLAPPVARNGRGRRSAPLQPEAPNQNSGSIRIIVQEAAPSPAPEPSTRDAELLSRLAKLEAMVAVLDRKVPATAELFSEWVRLRAREEITFAEFLRRRRAGVV